MPKFTTKSGKPRDLQLSRGRESFFALAKVCSPDITPIAMLKELQRQGAVRLLAGEKVRLVGWSDSRVSLRKKELRAFEAQLDDFANQAFLTVRNEPDALFMGTKVAEDMTPTLASLFVRQFSERAAGLLDAIPKWVEANPSGAARAENGKSVGVGVFLFERPLSAGVAHKNKI